MAWTYHLLALVAGTAVHQVLTSGHASIRPPKQSPWQKALFDRIEKNAQKLSDEARPELLKRLDGKEFRQELAACCPSLKDLSAQELLAKLEAEIAVAEVISGFPALSNTKDMSPDAPGMSVADGLAGSFFQSAWQAVLLQSKDPEKVFHQTLDEYATVTGCSSTGNSVSLKMFWGACHGPVMSSATYPQSQCMHDPSDHIIFKVTCQDGALYEEDWADDWQVSHLLKKGRHRLHSHRKLVGDSIAYPNVTCPNRAADYQTKYIADSKCHPFVYFNASDSWIIEDQAEQDDYGLKSFSAPGYPKTLLEASERGPYALVNDFLQDAGSPLYGDVSAVFSMKAMQRTALLSAVDTGFYAQACVGQQGGGGTSPEWRHNCSAYKPLQQLGTLQHCNHLRLINEDFWKGHKLLAHRFSRLEGAWGSNAILGRDLLGYWEAVPAGTMYYPEDVRFLIGSFPLLFGTPAGVQLQHWAKQRNWVLVWSLGLNVEGQGDSKNMNFDLLSSNSSFQLNQRLVDPEVALETTAATSLAIGNSTLRIFQQSWKHAEVLRWSHGGYVSNKTWASQWQELRDKFPTRLAVRPLRGGECSRQLSVSECIGVSADMHCICYTDNSSNVELIV